MKSESFLGLALWGRHMSYYFMQVQDLHIFNDRAFWGYWSLPYQMTVLSPVTMNLFICGMIQTGVFGAFHHFPSSIAPVATCLKTCCCHQIQNKQIFTKLTRLIHKKIFSLYCVLSSICKKGLANHQNPFHLCFKQRPNFFRNQCIVLV